MIFLEFRIKLLEIEIPSTCLKKELRVEQKSMPSSISAASPAPTGEFRHIQYKTGYRSPAGVLLFHLAQWHGVKTQLQYVTESNATQHNPRNATQHFQANPLSAILAPFDKAATFSIFLYILE